MRVAVFVERDGILDHAGCSAWTGASSRSLSDLEVNEEAIQPLAQLKESGLLLIATSNLPGLSRGELCRREVDQINDLLRARFQLDDMLICPHDEMDKCLCRKPEIGLFTEAAFRWHVDLERSFVVSDKWQDALAAQAARMTSVMLDAPSARKGRADYWAPNLKSAAARILQLAAAPAGARL